MVVHLEVFTKWARHASPLHRHAPDWTGMVCVGVSGGSSRSPLRIIGVNLRNLRFGVPWVRGGHGQQIGVDGGSPGGLYEVGEACLAPTQTRPRWERYGVRGRFRAPFPFPLCIVGVNLRNLRFGVPWVRGGRGQQSGSMVVNLEVFTKWARHASPLHRHAPDGSGMVCVGVSGRRSRSPFA